MKDVVTEPLDVTGIPELARIAEAVRRTGVPRVLRHAGRDVALVVPLAAKRAAERRPRARRRVPTAAELEAFNRTAGGWADVDTDRLVEDIYESRRTSSRPVVEL